MEKFKLIGNEFDVWAQKNEKSREMGVFLADRLNARLAGGQIDENEAKKIVEEINSAEKMDMGIALKRVVQGKSQAPAKPVEVPGGDKPQAATPEMVMQRYRVGRPPSMMPSQIPSGGPRRLPSLTGHKLPPSRSKKPSMKQVVIAGVVVFALVVVALLGYNYFISSKDTGSSYTFSGETGTPAIGFVVDGGSSGNAGGGEIVVDNELNKLPPEGKKEWASRVLENTLGDPALKRPASWSEAFENFPWTWLIYFLGAPILLFMVYRDRSQAQEQSDIKLANQGFWFMFVATILSEVVSKALVPVVFTNVTVAVFVVLVIGMIGSIVFQWSAVTSGKMDFTVLSVGIFSTGLLIKWWLASNPILAVIATVFMVVGMILQMLEIRRNAKDVDSDIVVVLNIIGVILMIVAFVVIFGFVFVTIQNAIGNTPIPIDAQAATKAAAQVELYSNGQMPISIALGAVSALIVGIFWGALALKPSQSKGMGRPTDGKLIGDVSLDADMMVLFIMILWFLMPWMSWLPTLVLLFV